MSKFVSSEMLGLELLRRFRYDLIVFKVYGSLAGLALVSRLHREGRGEDCQWQSARKPSPVN